MEHGGVYVWWDGVSEGHRCKGVITSWYGAMGKGQVMVLLMRYLRVRVQGV